MKLFKAVTLIFLAFALVGGCKKYPDGPLLNIYPPNSRVNGYWDVEYFGINGNDSTAYLKSLPYYAKYHFAVTRDAGKLSAEYGYYQSLSYRSGFWELQDRKNNLYIEFLRYSGSSVSALGPYGASGVSWEIRRLMSEQLWLRTIYKDGREYFVKFKRIHI